MIDLNVYVCIPFGEKTRGTALIPGWRSLTLADPGPNHVSPSGKFPRTDGDGGEAGSFAYRNRSGQIFLPRDSQAACTAVAEAARSGGKTERSARRCPLGDARAGLHRTCLDRYGITVPFRP